MQLFERVEATKPTASRSTSAEIYIICLKYKAPAKIQPELLDIKHLFSVVPEQTKVRYSPCLNYLSGLFSLSMC
jgi:AdoMet-dependent rRNA methyltransferase SPB1